MPASALTAQPAYPATSGIKLAQPIEHAIIISFERRPDQKMWYVIQVNPQQTDFRLVNGHIDTVPVFRHSYTIARRYEDFCQFAQRLHDAFPSQKSLRAGSRHKEFELPKLKGRLHLLPSRQVHVQRRTELDRFIQALFRLPPSVSQSPVVLGFFGMQKEDDDQIAIHPCDTLAPRQPSRLLAARSSEHLDFSAKRAVRKISSQPNLAQHPAPTMKESPSLKDIIPNSSRVGSSLALECNSPLPPTPSSSRWKRLRCTSFRNRTPSASPSLSALCTQAANLIIPWNRNPTSRPSMSASISTPVPKKLSRKAPQPLVPITDYQRRPSDQPVSPTSSSILSSMSSSRISQSTCATSITPSPSTSPTLRMIKIKVIYDVDNIVVIQVPRSIMLEELKSKITRKFSDPTMEAVHLDKDFVLLYNDARSSASSSYDTCPTAATLIAKNQDLIHTMNSKWERLDKVTIRCIV